MSSAKFDALAAKVGSKRLAGYITTHNPKVRARAEATRAAHKAGRKAATAASKPAAPARLAPGDKVTGRHPAYGAVSGTVARVHKDGSPMVKVSRSSNLKPPPVPIPIRRADVRRTRKAK